MAVAVLADWGCGGSHAQQTTANSPRHAEDVLRKLVAKADLVPGGGRLTDDFSSVVPGTRLPRRVLQLLQNEALRRGIGAEPGFQMDDGRCAFVWFIGGGVKGHDDREVLKRLKARAIEMGFLPREPTGTRLPAGGERPGEWTEYWRGNEELEERFLIKDHLFFRHEVVDIDMIFDVRTVHRVPPPTYAQVIGAAPYLKALPIGANSIPEAALAVLADRPVTRLLLSGNPWDNYDVFLPIEKVPPRDQAILLDRLSTALRANGFSTTQYLDGRPRPEIIVDLDRKTPPKGMMVEVRRQDDEYWVKFIAGL